MSWSTTVPTNPGRYFYRNRSNFDYGICLVAWDRGWVAGDHVRQPSLEVRAWCTFGRNHPPPEEWKNGATGENTDYASWSYGGSTRSDAIEFWSEPMMAPTDFPAVVSVRPPDFDVATIEAAATQAKDSLKRSKAEQAKRKRQLQKAAKDAIRDGATLYQCAGCEELCHAADLVDGKLRECPHCSETFVEGDNGRNCPTCNRPFTRVEEEHETCPRCYEDGEMPEVTLIVSDGERTDSDLQGV